MYIKITYHYDPYHITLAQLCSLYIYFPLEPNDISIALYWSLAESAGHFWWPEEFKSVENPDLEDLKNLQKPGNLLLTAASMSLYKFTT